MTVDTTTSGENLPANYPSTGLEDFDVTDAIIPRLSIVHKNATFKDNLSGREFNELNLIILGLTKQRILWHHNVDGDGEAPMCKSPNFETGYPNLEASRDKAFPWERSGFDPDTIPLSPTGQKPLPCSNCQLKEWGSHPNGNTPYCSEQWTLSVMYDPDGDNDWVPAFLTLQRSSIKPIRSYLTSFARSNKPAFTAICKAKLSLNSRGSVDYSVPSFTGIGESDRDKWLEYSQSFDSMRGYLVREDEGAAALEEGNANTGPTEDPWTGETVKGSTEPTPEPAAPTTPPPTPEQQQPVTQPPVATPPVSTPPPTPAAAPATAPQASAAQDDDLPF